jgi:hypothetical protein
MAARMFDKPVDWDQLYPGRFIKTGDLLGKNVTLKIASIDLDELEGETGKKVKGVISFERTESNSRSTRRTAFASRRCSARRCRSGSASV